MPNYSHGTKLTLASVEEPPYLTVGTDVSAKYKGAFCEAKIIDVNKHVKLRVLFDGTSGSYLIDDTDLKTGSALTTGTRIEAKHPEKKQQTYVQATITKILDHSRYTVVFDDGDQCILRRNSLCLKSGKHFAESETLDQLPLTNPEHFGNPVKVGAAEQLNNTSNATNNNTSSSTTSTTTTNSTTTTITTSTNKTQNNHLLLNDKPKVKSSGKRRESVNNGSKNAMDLDDNSVDSSIESGDANSAETNVKYELIEVGVKLMVQYGKGKIQNFYEAKVNKIETNNAGKIRYFVHYTGWNNRYDEWITKNRIHSIVVDKENGSRDRKSRHPDVSATIPATVPISSSTATNTPKTEPKEKPEKEKAPRTRRARQTEASANTPVTTNSNQNATPTTNSVPSNSATSIATTIVTVTPSPVSATSATPVTNTSVTTTPVNSVPVTTAKSTATPSAQTTVDSTKDVITKPVTAPPTRQAAVAASTNAVTPKIENRLKPEKELAPRTRRARLSEAPVVETPVTTNSTQHAPLPTNSVTITSSISITTSASVTTGPPVTCTLAPTKSVAIESVTNSPVTLASATPTPSITTAAPVAQTTVVSTKDIPMMSMESPSPPLASTEKVKDPDTVDTPAVNDSRPTYRFCDDIDESDCDKKISILQERIMALRQTYTSLKTELADLDRRKKRPRTERSNSDHINNCSVVCRS